MPGASGGADLGVAVGLRRSAPAASVSSSVASNTRILLPESATLAISWSSDWPVPLKALVLAFLNPLAVHAVRRRPLCRGQQRAQLRHISRRQPVMRRDRSRGGQHVMHLFRLGQFGRVLGG